MAECYLQLRQKEEAVKILAAFQRRGIKNGQINDMMNSLR